MFVVCGPLARHAPMSRQNVSGEKPPSAGVRQALYRWFGALFLGLGTLGIAVPLLPTVPFWIVAAFFFARSEPALRDRIYAHPRFGKPVQDFLEHGALSRRGKIAAVVGIAVGITISVFAFSMPGKVALIVALCLLPVVIFVLTRPEAAYRVEDDRNG